MWIGFLQVYESEDFYFLADKYGVLIWQDFMFACALYPTDTTFINNVREEVIHQVLTGVQMLLRFGSEYNYKLSTTTSV